MPPPLLRPPALSIWGCGGAHLLGVGDLSRLWDTSRRYSRCLPLGYCSAGIRVSTLCLCGGAMLSGTLCPFSSMCMLLGLLVRSRTYLFRMTAESCSIFSLLSRLPPDPLRPLHFCSLRSVIASFCAVPTNTNFRYCPIGVYCILAQL